MPGPPGLSGLGTRTRSPEFGKRGVTADARTNCLTASENVSPGWPRVRMRWSTFGLPAMAASASATHPGWTPNFRMVGESHSCLLGENSQAHQGTPVPIQYSGTFQDLVENPASLLMPM